MSTTLIQISAAKNALAKASTFGDILEIRDKAAAIKVYMKSAGDSLAVQNQAAEIKLRAERKAGQLLSEMEKQNGSRGVGKKVEGQDVSPLSTLSDLGITPKQSSRWQAEATVSEEDFDSLVDEINKSGEELTQASLLKKARGAHVSNNSGEHEWYTPAEFIVAATRVMGGIDLDPASSKIANKTVKATAFFTEQQNGLDKIWTGRVWMNPPYAQPLIALFSAKLAESINEGTVTQAIVLVNNATETGWWQQIAEVSSAACFPKTRVRFLDPEGNPGAPLQGQTILYCGKNKSAFCKVFAAFGKCWSA